MRKTVFALGAMVLLLAVMLSCTACESYTLDLKQSKRDIVTFLNAIEDGDYQTASGYLHPAHQVDLAAAMQEVPAEYRGPFQIGIESSADFTNYTHSFSEAVYSREYERTLGSKIYFIYCAVTKDSEGYGISGFVIRPLD